MKIEELLNGTSDAEISVKMKRVAAAFEAEFGHIDPEARSSILLQTAVYLTSLVILDAMYTRPHPTIKDMIVDMHMIATGLSADFERRLLGLIESSVVATLADILADKKGGEK
jgi:hypothetical protein